MDENSLQQKETPASSFRKFSQELEENPKLAKTPERAEKFFDSIPFSNFSQFVLLNIVVALESLSSKGSSLGWAIMVSNLKRKQKNRRL